MVIELFGMPGSGKTTIANYYEREKNIRNIQKDYKDKLDGKIKFHIFLKFFIINKELKKIYNNLLEIVNNSSNYINELDEKINIKLYIKYIIFDYYLENHCNKDIILEEGIIHYCIALYAEFNVEFDKLDIIIDKLHIDENQIVCIGIKSTIEEVLKNIKKRNRKQCSLDYLEESKLIEILKRYNEGIKYFSNKYEILKIEEIKKKLQEKL